MDGLKPSDSLVYLYYTCSKCNEQGDEVRVSQAKQSVAYHTCPWCGHVDRIATIDKIVPKYKSVQTTATVVQPAPPRPSIPFEWIASTKQRLIMVGYRASEVDGLVKKTIKGMTSKPASAEALFKQVVLLAEKK